MLIRNYKENVDYTKQQFSPLTVIAIFQQPLRCKLEIRINMSRMERFYEQFFIEPIG